MNTIENYNKIIVDLQEQLKQRDERIAELNVKLYDIESLRYYNYHEAVKNDTIEYIKKNINTNDFDSVDELKQRLYDTLFVSDNVTGNASGSYTFCTWTAQQYIINNLDLLEEALSEFGDDLSALSQGAEACDVTIRCYLLGEAIENAINELNIVEV